MKKLVLGLCFAFAPVVGAVVSASGCANPCEDLSELCDLCADSHYRSSCSRAVELQNHDLCGIYKSTFQQVCVGVGGSGGAPPGCTTAGQVFCSGSGGNGTSACVSLQTDPANCGTCGHACGATEVCVSGGCSSNCPNGLTACCGACIDTRTDPANCGGCSDPLCLTGAGGAGGGAAQGEVCGAGGSAAFCVNGACGACLAPNTDCSGACVDTSSNAAHCGACGNGCPPGNLCSNGQCGSCPPGESACGGQCVDTATDAQNCGSCGNACQAATPLCSNGTCVFSCDAGLTACPTAAPTSCVNVLNDPDNCGTCDNPCAAPTPVCVPAPAGTGGAGGGPAGLPATCETGCPQGLANCNGACVDVNTDFNNCGNCGQSCNDNSVCTSDACSNGQCQHFAASACTPANKCQIGGCDPVLGCMIRGLTLQEIDSLCNDPTPCCEASAGCVAAGVPGAICP
ncbi:MAG: hypothetical protein IT373_10430 [Polyangiaceae bacterium]|nr:hypothetical protein [Polyangiaceae bacterium]